MTGLHPVFGVRDVLEAVVYHVARIVQNYVPKFNLTEKFKSKKEISVLKWNVLPVTVINVNNLVLQVMMYTELLFANSKHTATEKLVSLFKIGSTLN